VVGQLRYLAPREFRDRSGYYGAGRLEIRFVDALQARMALLTFSRPPVTVIADSDGMWSTLFKTTVFKLAVFKEHRERISRADPETWGVAMEVPLM